MAERESFLPAQKSILETVIKSFFRLLGTSINFGTLKLIMQNFFSVFKVLFKFNFMVK